MIVTYTSARYGSALWYRLTRDGWVTVQVDDEGVAILVRGAEDTDIDESY